MDDDRPVRRQLRELVGQDARTDVDGARDVAGVVLGGLPDVDDERAVAGVARGAGVAELDRA